VGTRKFRQEIRPHSDATRAKKSRSKKIFKNRPRAKKSLAISARAAMVFLSASFFSDFFCQTFF
jgi:hypothetical protein